VVEHDAEAWVSAGDWQVLYRRYFSRIVRYCARSGGDSADAEDLAQQVFVQLARTKIPEKPLPYLQAIARNVLAQYRRRRAAEQAARAGYLGDAELATEGVEWPEAIGDLPLRDSRESVKEILMAVVRKLPPQDAQVNKSDPKWEGLLSLGDSSGSKFTAWRLNREFWNVDRKTPLAGSYGWSIYVPMTYSACPAINGLPPARARMPFLLDCVLAYAPADGSPPAYDGDLSSYGMKSVCIDRHNGGINSLFMDWSVHKVGLKELWTLKWCSGYNTSGPWTRAGGAHRRTGRRG
jgi:prepilin-type processing-associated H-X9-DG protein